MESFSLKSLTLEGRWPVHSMCLGCFRGLLDRLIFFFGSRELYSKDLRFVFPSNRVQRDDGWE